MKRHFYKLRKLILGKPDLRDDYYSNLISQFNKPDSYNLLVKKCSKNHINTNVEINFSDVLKFNCSIKQFKKTISYKCYYEKQNKTLNTRILFYKLEMGDHKVKCQVHFHNGELFYFNYTFPYLNNENKHEIIKILSTKYLPEMTNYYNNPIWDNQNNCIQIEDSIELTFNYIAMESVFFKKIIEMAQEKTELEIIKKRVNTKDILSKI